MLYSVDAPSSLPSWNESAFYEKLTPGSRKVYDSLDEEHKKKALQFAQKMPNPNQAVFLAAQEALSNQPDLKGSPQNTLNVETSIPKQPDQKAPVNIPQDKVAPFGPRQNFTNYQPYVQNPIPNVTRP